MAGRGLRRTMTISEQAKPERKSSGSGDGNKKNASAWAKGRTLLDIIRQEQQMAGSGSAAGSVRNADSGVLNWKSFRDRIRLRRAGNAWTEEFPASATSLLTRSISNNNMMESDNDDSSPLPIFGQGGGGGEAAQTSLMSFLGMGEDEEDDEEGEEDEEEEEEDEELYHQCCVCMVSHKGEPFVPCGHTFCRLCSREMCTTEGTCPLCTGFILEILNIF